MLSLRETLRSFLALYRGNKVCFLITGGGTSLATLGSIPGSSHILYAMYMPWADGALKSFKQPDTPSSSVEGVREYIRSMAAHLRRNDQEDVDIVVVSAALPTVRVRRGTNRAIIGIRRDGATEMWELALPKEIRFDGNWPIAEYGGYDNYIDAEREKQDEQITRAIIHLLLKPLGKRMMGLKLQEKIWD